MVEDLLTGAGLIPAGSGGVECPFVYPDLETGWRGQAAAGPLRKAIEVAGEAAVREACVNVHGDFRQPDGSYRLENVFRYVIGEASLRVTLGCSAILAG